MPRVCAWGAWVRSARADSHVLATCHACISTLAPITSRSASAQCPPDKNEREAALYYLFGGDEKPPLAGLR